MKLIQKPPIHVVPSAVSNPMLQVQNKYERVLTDQGGMAAGLNEHGLAVFLYVAV